MKVLLYIAFILPLGVFSQGEVGYIFEDLTQDSLEKRTVKLHTTMKPFIRQKGFSENYMKATGLADINASYSDGVQYIATLEPML